LGFLLIKSNFICNIGDNVSIASSNQEFYDNWKASVGHECGASVLDTEGMASTYNLALDHSTCTWMSGYDRSGESLSISDHGGSKV